VNAGEGTGSLAGRLRERIRREGVVTFRDWMEAALYDPRGGYYTRADLTRWGRSGDYRTSPERSPLFAATFARYFAALHAQLGSPARWTICEAGAGPGLFARGVLETLEREHPTVFRATRYLLDEIGGDTRARAAQSLAPFGGRVGFTRIAEDGEPFGEGVVFSNELFDAFPVHRVRMRGGALRELYVGLNEGGRFVWREGEPSTPHLAEHFAGLGVALAEGQAAEVNLEAGDWLARVAGRLTRGLVVTVDYGAAARELYDPAARPDGTLRAFRAHTLSDDVLSDPGGQDLTSTVNWTQLRRAGEGAGLRTVLLERQDAFLLGAGFLEQLEAATAGAADEAERASLRLSAREMILPGGMSGSFQVLVQSKSC
jgi:SAM-dependent MidA family methyltransferase